MMGLYKNSLVLISYQPAGILYKSQGNGSITPHQ
jgi:hypothetical protein